MIEVDILNFDVNEVLIIVDLFVGGDYFFNYELDEVVVFIFFLQQQEIVEIDEEEFVDVQFEGENKE